MFKKNKTAIPLILLTVFILTGCQLPKAISDSNTNSESEKNAADSIAKQLRIENEDKIVVPFDKVEEVSDYLLEKYIQTDKFVKELDPNLTATTSIEEFIDTYYDTPDLKVMAAGDGVRYRQRTNLTNEEDRKNGRELMQIKISGIDSADGMSRGELKFDIEHLENMVSVDDKHPMIGLVKASQRKEFKEALSDLGFNPYIMEQVLVINDHRQRIYLLYNGGTFISISLDSATAERNGQTAQFIEIEPELNEVVFTEGDDAKREMMKGINKKIIDDLMAKFPYLYRDLTPKYEKGYNATK